MQNNQLTFSPSDFVAIANQTLEFAFGLITIEGELSSFRVSKGKWLYFDLKDAAAKVSCFGTVYVLPGPLEDGMVVRVACTPRLHPQFGFSLTVQSIVPSGEGSLKKAFELLQARLAAEGLFASERKRSLPGIPRHIALVASVESAAYADFIKVLGARWPYAQVDVFDTHVQGDAAPGQLMRAIEAANRQADLADVLVVTRGGGSIDDLAAFNDERVVRAIAASRIPTIVAIGHEVDSSLAEQAADVRASTPSNAAELVVPDRTAELRSLQRSKAHLASQTRGLFMQQRTVLGLARSRLAENAEQLLRAERMTLGNVRRLLSAYDPRAVMSRGYAIVYVDGIAQHSVEAFDVGGAMRVELYDGSIDATVKNRHHRKQ